MKCLPFNEETFLSYRYPVAGAEIKALPDMKKIMCFLHKKIELHVSFFFSKNTLRKIF